MLADNRSDAYIVFILVSEDRETEDRRERRVKREEGKETTSFPAEATIYLPAFSVTRTGEIYVRSARKGFVRQTWIINHGDADRFVRYQLKADFPN